MFFEGIIISSDYESLQKKHYVDKDRIVEEKKLTAIPNGLNKLEIPLILTNKEKKSMDNFRQINFTYKDLNSIKPDDNQIIRFKNLIKGKELKSIVLQTSTNDNNLAIQRLEAIFDLLEPEQRVKTIYQQDFCNKDTLCNITRIKLVY